MTPLRAALGLSMLVGLSACKTIGPLYPPRPPASEGMPVADPDPSRIVIHTAITRDGLQARLHQALPSSGEGTFSVLGSQRKYAWRRTKPELRFGEGRIGIFMGVQAQADMPLTTIDVPMNVRVWAEPVISSEYVASFQRVEVSVTSDDRAVRAVDGLAGILDKVRSELLGRMEGFRYDVRPLVEQAYAKLSAPLPLPLGNASGCAKMRVLGLEAGPTVLADGLEKDVALVVLPSVVLPCDTNEVVPPLPPLSNVAMVPSGPFTVTAAIAARYEELSKAMELAFPDGKYHFSKQYPEAYLEKPEVYYSKDKLVVRVHLAGPVSKLGFDEMLDGDMYFTGSPTVVDNELRILDLQPTVETGSFLLKLKAAVDGDTIRDQAQAALRLDLSERLAAVKAKLAEDLKVGGPEGCARGEVTKIAVTGVHPHGSYLRIYVAATGQARVEVPCSN